jgi:UDP-glucose 6-dehydrogenase
VEIVARTIASVEGGEKVVVEKSTVPVTTADRIHRVFEACGAHERLEVGEKERERGKGSFLSFFFHFHF